MTPLDSLQTAAATYPLQNAWLTVTGEDRTRWLNGMVTNNITTLEPGKGNYNFLLNAQGRIQGDAYIFNVSNNLLLSTSSTQSTTISQLLEKFIIMDDVEIKISTGEGLAVVGPTAKSTLDSLGISVPETQLSLSHSTFNNSPIDVLFAYSPGVQRYELYAENLSALRKALENKGVPSAPPEAVEQLRILEGIPEYGKDIRDRDLPQETNQTRALHFSKGCYLGQEIVERIRSRGAVHRTLLQFNLIGDFPPANTPLEADGKPIGELTSTTQINNLQRAIGYARREALERNALLTYPGGTAEPLKDSHV